MDFTPEAISLSFNGWRPDDPYDQNDFRAFETWVDRELRPHVESLMEPVGENWTQVRERARRVCALRYWLAGVLAAAENYLAAAKRYASYIREEAVGDQARSDKIKWRMESLVKDEKHLVQLLARYLEALDRDVSYLQSELRSLDAEARLSGLESS